jgi:hypothetical protein
LNDAAEQKATMAKATISLLAAADMAVRDNAGFRAVSIFPDVEDGHSEVDPVCETAGAAS